MAEYIIVSGKEKKEKYESLLPQIKALVTGETDFIANISNITSALKYGMNFFWVGVYFVASPLNPLSIRRGESLSTGEAGGQGDLKTEAELVLGPFQGPIACTRIALGKGVCGTAWKEKRVLIVEDVDKFPGHIACSSDSRSEIVLPCFKDGKIFAILDVDSDKLNDFDETDKKYLETVVEIINSLNEA